MPISTKASRSARRRKARRRMRFRLASFGLGVFITLILVVLFMNGRGYEQNAPPSIPDVVSSNVEAPSNTSLSTASPLLTNSPTLTPTLTPEPVPSIKATETTPTSKTGSSSSSSSAALVDLKNDEVSTAPTSITLDVEDKIVMQKDDVIYISVEFFPSGTSSALTWKTSDDKVIKVNQEGGVKAVGKGTAKVGVWTDEGLNAVINVKVEDIEKESGGSVWIPRTGEKYHSSSKCSNMKNPKKVSLSEAKSKGYTACKKCY